MIGVIGGSGLYDIEGVDIREVREIETPFGPPSDAYRIGDFSGRSLVFLPRHGAAHHLPPHKINYRANIWGFKHLGADCVIALSATGGITDRVTPGSIVLPDQILDFTSGRDATYHSGEAGVVHIDFTHPYCPAVRDALREGAKRAGTALVEPATYVCTNGPRLETWAEIRAFSLLGADVVGMTAMPEAALAREAELCYAGVCVVTNFAAGVSGEKLTVKEVVEQMKSATERLKRILRETFPLISPSRACRCRDALRDARV